MDNISSAQQSAIVYRLYTEDKGSVTDFVELVNRYFDGATLYLGVDVWQHAVESSRVIEIIGTLDDLQRIVDLAGDIKVRHNQTCVLLTYHPVKRLDI